MSESIDIESLDPLYRNVFRDPANGTPDDISKAGCLAMARLGKDAWNEWRATFPADYDEENGEMANNVDFSYVDFAILKLDGFISANFSGFHFGDWATFQGAKFPDHAGFHFADFGVLANFSETAFGVAASFGGARFDVNANFDAASFQELAIFDRATFLGAASFSATPWGAKNEDRTIRVLRSISFRGVTFCGQADFSGRIFDGSCSFSIAPPFGSAPLPRATTFEKAPVFHNCRLHQDTTFDGAIFPKAAGSDEAARAYRTLKLAFSQQQAIREEQRFFKLEMAEEAARATGAQRFLYKAYALCSDYGFSVARPLAVLGLALFGFAGIYGFFSWVTHCWSNQSACQFNSSWVEFSLIQALPLPGLDKLGEELRKSLFPSSGGISILVTLAVIFHKTISIAALFLGGLALRNLFKLK